MCTNLGECIRRPRCPVNQAVANPANTYTVVAMAEWSTWRWRTEAEMVEGFILFYSICNVALLSTAHVSVVIWKSCDSSANFHVLIWNITLPWVSLANRSTAWAYGTYVNIKSQWCLKKKFLWSWRSRFSLMTCWWTHTCCSIYAFFLHMLLYFTYIIDQLYVEGY